MLVREELVADGPDLDAIIWIDPRQARHHELLLEHPGKRGSAVLAGRGVGYLLVVEAYALVPSNSLRTFRRGFRESVLTASPLGTYQYRLRSRLANWHHSFGSVSFAFAPSPGLWPQSQTSVSWSSFLNISLRP
jgi:hypothetical protein